MLSRTVVAVAAITAMFGCAVAGTVPEPPVPQADRKASPRVHPIDVDPTFEHECAHDHHSVQELIAHDLRRNAHVQQRRADTAGRGKFAAQAPQAIRFVLSTEDLTDSSKYCTAVGQSRPDFKGGTITCVEEDIFSSAQRTLLVDHVLPTALGRLSAHLRVERYTSNLVVGSSACSHFTIPSSHSTTGVPSADFVLYVAAGPVAGSTVAWAGTCQKDNGRPIVGRANFDPQYLVNSSAAAFESMVDTAVHELLHALGFSSSEFSQGSRSSTTTRRGKTVTQLVTSNVLAAARTMSGCSSLTGVELEDEGSSGSAGSHFERRLYKDDVMTAAGGDRITRLTLAALEDMQLGFTMDYTGVEEMSWGKGDGCGFHTEPCNTAAGGAGKYFCFDPSTSNHHCTYDLTAFGYCSTSTYSSDLPSHFQYFAGEPRRGGGTTFMDYCPYVVKYSNRVCNDASYAASDSDYTFGHTYATDSRCFIARDVIRNGFSAGNYGGARCLQASCSSSSQISFRINGSSPVECPSDNANISSLPGYKGTVQCPVATKMCTSLGGTPAATTSAAPTTATSTSTSAAGTTTTAAPTAPPPPTDTCNTRYLLSGPSPSPVLTVDAINGILTEHNNARRTVSPMASRMPMLTWNQTLANFAQEYMDGCPGMTHSTNAMRSNSSRFGYSYIGENLAAGTSSTAYGAANGGASSTRAWNAEVADWTYPMTCKSGAVCGHYTQVIWANSLEVGCGYKYCPSQPYRNYWSCVYGPGGNYGGQNPYPQATSASDAAECQYTGSGTLPPYTTGAPGSSTTTTAAPTTTPTTTAGATTTTGAAGPASTTAAMNTTTTAAPGGNNTQGNGTSTITTTPAPNTTVAVPTDAPAPTPEASRRIIDGFVRLVGSRFAQFMNTTARRERLRLAVRADIARRLNVRPEGVVIVAMRVGSLEVNFTVTDTAVAASGSQPVTAASLESQLAGAEASAAWLVNTSALYGGETGQALSVGQVLSQQPQAAVATSPQPTAPLTPPTPPTTAAPPANATAEAATGCDSSCKAFYGVVIIGALVVIGAVILTFWLCSRGAKSGGGKDAKDVPADAPDDHQQQGPYGKHADGAETYGQPAPTAKGQSTDLYYGESHSPAPQHQHQSRGNTAYAAPQTKAASGNGAGYQYQTHGAADGYYSGSRRRGGRAAPY